MKSFLLALQFLTILPIGKREKVSPDELKRTVIYFPVVGVVQGVLLWLISHFLYSLFPGEAASGILLLFWVLITGALHLDGLADTIDGLAGGKNREDILRIMKDSNIGSFGVVSLVIILILKLLAIYSLPPHLRLKTLFMAPIIGKGGILLLNFHSRYARGEGLGRAFIEGTTARELTLTIILIILLTLFFVGLKGMLLLLILALLIYMIKRYIMKKIEGVTGDTMGAAVEVSEVIYLLGSLI